jgi:hypothetical protein
MQDCQKSHTNGPISRRMPLTIFHFRNGPQALDGLHGCKFEGGELMLCLRLR